MSFHHKINGNLEGVAESSYLQLTETQTEVTWWLVVIDNRLCTAMVTCLLLSLLIRGEHLTAWQSKHRIIISGGDWGSDPWDIPHPSTPF